MKMGNKLEKTYEVLDFTKQNKIASVIFAVILIPIYLWIIIDGSLNIIWSMFFFLMILLHIFLIVRSFSIQVKMLFDYAGFTYLTRNRINGKNTTESYRWEEIEYIRGSSSYLTGSSYLKITYRKKLSDKIDFPTNMYRKFTHLAIKYSGRKNIVRPFGLRPFEKV